MTVQLATRISPKTKLILDKLNKKTQVPICQLIEKAILLLEQHYQQLLHESRTSSAVDDRFMELLDYSMKKHDKLYKALANIHQQHAPTFKELAK